MRENSTNILAERPKEIKDAAAATTTIDGM